MKKQILIIGIIFITFGAILITSSVACAQGGNEFTVPLSDPTKRGKLKANINYGSITVKGTARKDILVKYKSIEEGEHDNEDKDDDDDDRHRHHVNVKVNVNVDGHSNDKSKSKEGIKRISGSGMDL